MKQPIPIFPSQFLGLLALLPAAWLGGCAENPYKASTSAYYRDAQTCRAQNPAGPKAGGTTAAGDSSPDSVAGFDTHHYLKCMERLGYHQDAKTDPLLRALAKCRQHTDPPAAAQPEAGGARLDQAAFRECLKQRGIEGSETDTGPSQTTGSK